MNDNDMRLIPTREELKEIAEYIREDRRDLIECAACWGGWLVLILSMTVIGG